MFLNYFIPVPPMVISCMHVCVHCSYFPEIKTFQFEQFKTFCRFVLKFTKNLLSSCHSTLTLALTQFFLVRPKCSSRQRPGVKCFSYNFQIIMKPMKFFKYEKNYFFKNMCREFNFTAFLRLILIRIFIALQLIDWCYLL